MDRTSGSTGRRWTTRHECAMRKCGHSGSGSCARLSHFHQVQVAARHRQSQVSSTENGDIGSAQVLANTCHALGGELDITVRLGDEPWHRGNRSRLVLGGYRPQTDPLRWSKMTCRWRQGMRVGSQDRRTPRTSPSPAFPTRPSATCSLRLGARLDLGALRVT